MQKNSQETRIALLEQSQIYIIETLKEIKNEVRDFHLDVKQEFDRVCHRIDSVNDKFDKVMHWLLGTIGFGILSIIASFALRFYFHV